jgi:hypothetical protein
MLPELPLSTPALLFPAISLLLLAYTNRFLGLASLVRSLHASWRVNPSPTVAEQIQSLRARIVIIKYMQSLGVLSLMLCVVSMGLLFFGQQLGGQLSFGLSLLLMLGSLTLALAEIQQSGRALDLEVQDMNRP